MVDAWKVWKCKGECSACKRKSQETMTAVQFMASLKILYDERGRAQGDASHASGHASERCAISVLLESMDSC